MNSVTGLINQTTRTISKSLKTPDNFLKNLLKKNYMIALVALVLALYGPKLSPRLPKPVRLLFDNVVFKLLVLVLIIYLSNKNLEYALIVSIGFLFIMNLVNSLEVEEHFVKKYAENFSEFGAVLTETYKNNENNEKNEAEKEAERVAHNALGDFGKVSYQRGYEDGRSEECPVNNTGGLPYEQVGATDSEGADLKWRDGSEKKATEFENEAFANEKFGEIIFF